MYEQTKLINRFKIANPNRNDEFHPDRNKWCSRTKPDGERCNNQWERRAAFGYERLCEECYREVSPEYDR